MTELHPILSGTLASLAASVGTAVGAALVYTIRELKPRMEDALLSGAAGIMLAASFYSPLQPGLEYGVQNYGDRAIAVSVVIAGMLPGGRATSSPTRGPICSVCSPSPRQPSTGAWQRASWGLR